MSSSGVEAVFVPGDPARDGVLALWNLPGAATIGSNGADGELELVLPAGKQVRRVRRPARLVPLAEALRHLLSPSRVLGTASYRAWSDAALAGLGLIARGRMLPAVSGQGYGSWRVGPLDPEDHAWLRSFAAAMPPQAHALPIDGSTPVRIRSAEALVREFWDALADTVVRTSAASTAGPAAPFSTSVRQLVEGPTDWLTEAVRADQAGAKLVLRIQPNDPDDSADDSAQDDRAEADAGFRGVLQLRSIADPSLLVDIADFWTTPATVLSRFGAAAESDLMLGLRRGARVWPPLGAALQAATPTGIDLGDEEFRIEQLVWGAGGFAIALAVAFLGLVSRGFGAIPLLIMAFGAFIGGVLLRDRQITSQIKKREQSMISEFPTIADMLALSVAAGEGPVGALERVANTSKGELAKEFRLALAEARTGASLVEALESVGDRTNLSLLARFVDGIAVAVERGTPLADVLRAQAADVREVGKRELIESGSKKEIGMMVPVVFFVLPVIILFAFYPGAIQLETFGP